MKLLTACRETARRTFRIQNLHPEQESAMLAVLNERDALVSLPTGFGKSLIYQVPAMIVERPTIVISPLIALMTDQEHAPRKRGVPVVAFHSRLRAAERRAALERLKKGGRLVVLTTPETLESAATAPLFERARPALLCIDEAHCISEWGHDFRPSYLRLGNARKRLGNPPAADVLHLPSSPRTHHIHGSPRTKRGEATGPKRDAPQDVARVRSPGTKVSHHRRSRGRCPPRAPSRAAVPEPSGLGAAQCLPTPLPAASRRQVAFDPLRKASTLLPEASLLAQQLFKQY
jgi:hypothetical protein